MALIPTATWPATDTKNNGRYDDVNGNGRREFADVVLSLTRMTRIAANEPLDAFDNNANGRIDVAELVWLFGRL